MSRKQSDVLVALLIMALTATAMADTCSQCTSLVETAQNAKMELKVVLWVVCHYANWSRAKQDRCVERINKVLSNSSKTPRQVCEDIGVCKKAKFEGLIGY